ncbi:MAG: carbohydrate kinase family protein [Pararhodobacter sp.]
MILCCGEALIDMLPRVTDKGEPAFAPHAGGAVFNTARALGRLGAETGFLCGLSRDLFGEQLRIALSESQVDSALSPLSDRPTTLAFVTLIDGQARYAFYDENTAMRAMQVADLPVLPATVRAVFFGGISLVSEPCGTAFEALCSAAVDRVVMLDPNIRPGFIRDEPAYRARLNRMISRADIVKLSDEDLLWLVPDRPEAEAIAALLALGPALLLITRGAQGSEAHHHGGVLSEPGVPVTVVDTVGAGDTFNAGILAALDAAGALNRAALRVLPGETLSQALALANRVAAVTASRAGANPPWAGELQPPFSVTSAGRD